MRRLVRGRERQRQPRVRMEVVAGRDHQPRRVRRAPANRGTATRCAPSGPSPRCTRPIGRCRGEPVVRDRRLPRSCRPARRIEWTRADGPGRRTRGAPSLRSTPGHRPAPTARRRRTRRRSPTRRRRPRATRSSRAVSTRRIARATAAPPRRPALRTRGVRPRRAQLAVQGHGILHVSP